MYLYLVFFACLVPALGLRFNLHGTDLDFPLVQENVTLGLNPEVHAKALELQIRLPTSFRVAICPFAILIGNKVTCNYENGSLSEHLLQKDVAVAYDFPGECNSKKKQHLHCGTSGQGQSNWLVGWLVGWFWKP